MQTPEKEAFVRAMEIMRKMWNVPPLDLEVLNSYWENLKGFTVDQFTAACRKLMEKSRTDYGKVFPLPGDFIAAIPIEVEEYKPIGVADVPGRTGRILSQLIAMMPDKRHRNTDEEAAAMVAKMEAVIEKEFEKDMPLEYSCPRCHDEGYLYCWFQFKKGIRYEVGGEIAIERVPNSPHWIRRLGEGSPHPELNLTPCLARCTCSVGMRKERAVPLCNSFVSQG